MTLKSDLHKKWGWPVDGLANPHNSAGKPLAVRSTAERNRYDASKYLPHQGEREMARRAAKARK